MKEAEFRAKFPHASEQVIRLNCEDYGGARPLFHVEQSRPAPAPGPGQGVAQGKGRRRPGRAGTGRPGPQGQASGGQPGTGQAVPELARLARARLAAVRARGPIQTAPTGRRRVILTRNGGTWSEARFFQAVRSALRGVFQFWVPAKRVLEAARVPWPGPRGRLWGFLCERCDRLHVRKSVEVDHVEPCGACRTLDEVLEFLEKLTREDPAAFQVLCKKCHREKTDQEARARREARKSSPTCHKNGPKKARPAGGGRPGGAVSAAGAGAER